MYAGALFDRRALYRRASSILTFGFFILLWPVVISSCMRAKRTAYSSLSDETYPGWRYSEYGVDGYENNLDCSTVIEAYYDGDGVALDIVDVDIEEPHISGVYSTCVDKLEVFDGPSQYSPLIATICGRRTFHNIESEGSTLLVKFTTNHENSRTYDGYTLEYKSIDRGGSSSSIGLGPGRLAAIIIPSLLIYFVLFFVVYRRCKYAQRVRQNLAATGHTPEDMRAAMLTMVEQASRGPLRQPNHNNNSHENGSNSGEGNRGRSRRVNPPSAANNSAEISEFILQHMDANRDRRLGRVRHPAGDRTADQTNSPLSPPRLEINEEPDSMRASPVTFTIGADSHTPRHGSPISVGRNHVEDDRRSRGSGRSHRSLSSRLPYPQYQERAGDEEPNLHFYGVIDPSAPSYHDLDPPAPSATSESCEPPPSYEEAATGKYSPRLHRV